MNPDFEGELRELRPAKIPFGLEASLEAALFQGEQELDEEFAQLKPSLPSSELEQRLEVELSENLPFEAWLKQLSPTANTTALESSIGAQLAFSALEFEDAQVQTKKDEYTARFDRPERERFWFQKRTALSLLSAAALAMCAYWSGLWDVARTPEGDRKAPFAQTSRGGTDLQTTAKLPSVEAKKNETHLISPEALRSIPLQSSDVARAVGKQPQQPGAEPSKNSKETELVSHGVVPAAVAVNFEPIATATMKNPRDPSGTAEANEFASAWPRLATARTAAAESTAAQPLNAGTVISGTADSMTLASQGSPLLDALTDGRLLEALPPDLKSRIQDLTNSTPRVADAKIQSSEVTKAIPTTNRIPEISEVAAANRSDLTATTIAPNRDSSSPPTALGGNEALVLQPTPSGYKGDDGSVVFKLHSTETGITAQVTSKDGTVLSSAPISSGESFRILGLQAKSKLSGELTPKGD